MSKYQLYQLLNRLTQQQGRNLRVNAFFERALSLHFLFSLSLSLSTPLRLRYLLTCERESLSLQVEAIHLSASI